MSWAVQTAVAPVTSVPDLQGEYYLGFLGKVHATLRPKTYLEVGTYTGDSLELATCASISVDPSFQPGSGRIGTKPFCGFYQMRSDDFFAAHSPTAIFGRPVDLAFLDGLHFAEALLRDFINTERHCKPNSIIALHDCVPVDVYIADRDGSSDRRRRLGSRPDWWTGDVWKLMPILRRLRPDLSVHIYDATATGLVLVTNLDPSSTVLSDTYAQTLRDIRAMDLETYGLQRYLDELQIERTADYRIEADFAARFWL